MRAASWKTMMLSRLWVITLAVLGRGRRAAWYCLGGGGGGGREG